MSTRYRLMAGLLIGAALIGSTHAEDLPQLELHGPVSNERYLDTSSIVISGRVDPPLDIDVNIRLYHVVDDELVLPEGGAETRVDHQGRFSVSLFPRAGGWTAGQLRCVVSGGMRTLRSSTEVTVIDHADAAPVRLSEDSGITIDVGEDAGPDNPYEVVAGQVFYLAGGFAWESEVVRGPSIPVKIIHAGPVRIQDITAQSHSVLTYVNESGIAVFDAPVLAPAQRGNYILQLQRPVAGEDGRITYEEIERPLVIVLAAD